MTTAQVQRILKRITLGRAWRFRLDDSGDIVISVVSRNAYRRGPRYVKVYAWIQRPQRCRTERGLLRRVYEAISSILHHEIGEWLRYKGKRPFDPHA